MEVVATIMVAAIMEVEDTAEAVEVVTTVEEEEEATMVHPHLTMAIKAAATMETETAATEGVEEVVVEGEEVETTATGEVVAKMATMVVVANCGATYRHARALGC